MLINLLIVYRDVQQNTLYCEASANFNVHMENVVEKLDMVVSE